jgi:succinate-acetate transporter protein
MLQFFFKNIHSMVIPAKGAKFSIFGQFWQMYHKIIITPEKDAQSDSAF